MVNIFNYNKKWHLIDLNTHIYQIYCYFRLNYTHKYFIIIIIYEN